MALYADPNNPLNFDVPDLSGIIDRFQEGQLDDQAPEPSEDVYQGAAKGIGSNAGSASGQTPESIIGPDGYIHGRAAEFATPKDLANYARTGSLATGDNGIGAFGDKTSGARPGVAVPRDVLAHVYGDENAARGKMVEVIAPNGETHIFPILDKGPRLANRANNAVIEVNPAAKSILGVGDANGYKYKLLQ